MLLLSGRYNISHDPTTVRQEKTTQLKTKSLNFKEKDIEELTVEDNVNLITSKSKNTKNLKSTTSATATSRASLLKHQQP